MSLFLKDLFVFAKITIFLNPKNLIDFLENVKWISPLFTATRGRGKANQTSTIQGFSLSKLITIPQIWIPADADTLLLPELCCLLWQYYTKYFTFYVRLNGKCN